MSNPPRSRPLKPAEYTSGRFPFGPIDQGPEAHRVAVEQVAHAVRAIELRMTELDVSQRQLARDLEVEQSRISRVLRGQAWADALLLARIAGRLGFTLRLAATSAQGDAPGR